MRAAGVALGSAALTAAVLSHAYYQKRQFYPTVVYVTKSNVSMSVMYVQAFILVLLVGKLMKKIFFGQLRATEFEHLMERSWYALTETALALTLFKDDFNPKFIAFFTILLFLKSFHWLAEDRVDYMERSPIIGSLFHIRILSLLFTLAALDIFFIMHAYQTTVTKGASVQLVYGFEYCILIIMIINILIKYVIHAIDSHSPWENKAVVLLYTEFVIGIFKVLLYVSFVIVMAHKYTLPLFAFRQMYYTIRNFNKACKDVIMSRRAINNMNTLYPDATATELAAVDNVCIICREEMTSGAKKLPCNHIFHTSCLRSWFQRQQTCPTCRLNILRTTTPQPPPAAAPPPQPPPAATTIPPMQTPPSVNSQSASGSSQSLPMPGPNMNAFMGFPWTPPQMPPNLTTLTISELLKMEGKERHNIEARIQYLQNIQIMLDASVVMMQQYSAIANRFSPMFDLKDVAIQTDSLEAQQVEPNDTLLEKTEVPEKTNMSVPDDINVPGPSKINEIETNISDDIKTDDFQDLQSQESQVESFENTSSLSTNISKSVSESLINNEKDDADQVRRRRLQKFDQDH